MVLAEPALAGVPFDLYRWVSSTTIDPPSSDPFVVHDWEYIKSETSDSHGNFWFTDLDPGQYVVREALDGTDFIQHTGQAQGSPDTSYFRGGTRPSSLGDDPNASSTGTFLIQSRLEYAHEAAGHIMYVDVNGDGNIDADERAYAEQLQALKTPVFDEADSATQQALAAALIYGNNYKPGSIHGFKFEDIDGDGIWDQNSPYIGGAEPGLPNIWIGLRDADTGELAVKADGHLAYTMTDSTGHFWIENLVPGSYQIFEDLSKSDSNHNLVPDDAEGMIRSTPPRDFIDVGGWEEWAFEVGAAMLPPAPRPEIFPGVADERFEVFVDDQDNFPVSQVNENLIIGNFVTGSIHGFKWLDLDADGVYEPGEHDWEMPFEWGVFELVDEAGNPVLQDGHPVVHTDINGEFWFTDLVPGQTYTLRERADLTDRNDLNGDGFPDVVDVDGDGYPEQMGNGIPDDQEGLMSSTADVASFFVLSRQEFVWQPGASMLDPVIEIEPDDFDDDQTIVTPTGVTLSVADADGNVIAGVVKAESPNLNRMVPSTGELVFGHTAGGTSRDDQWSFEDDRLLRIDFELWVNWVSIDALADDSGMDVAAMFAYDSAGNLLDSDISGEIAQFEFETLTVSGGEIAYVLLGGLDAGPTSDTIGLDNLQFEIELLKEEVVVGEELMFGNFYAGAIHGLKLQQGTDLAAPNIPLQLIDTSGGVVDSTTTNDDGEYWFLDVVPGTYTVTEVETDAILQMASPVPVHVPHATAIFSSDIPAEDRVVYEGLQTIRTNGSLTLRNLIAGSIHGVVNDQTGNPVAGVDVDLYGPTAGSTSTGANGEFHFDDLLPGQYIVIVDGTPLVVHVDSGEEEVGYIGQAPLDPGQYETPNSQLTFEVFVEPSGLAADFDKDGDVDGQDFLIWQANFPTLDGSATQSTGDASGDGNVDGSDFLIWQSEFGTVSPAPGGGGGGLAAGRSSTHRTSGTIDAAFADSAQVDSERLKVAVSLSENTLSRPLPETSEPEAAISQTNVVGTAATLQLANNRVNGKSETHRKAEGSATDAVFAEFRGRLEVNPLVSRKAAASQDLDTGIRRSRFGLRKLNRVGR